VGLLLLLELLVGGFEFLGRRCDDFFSMFDEFCLLCSLQSVVDVKNYVDMLPVRGETLVLESKSQVQEEVGGKGLNQACQAALVCGDNGKVRFVSKIGNDARGKFVEKELRNFDVDTSFIVRDLEVETGVAHVVIDRNGDYYSVVNPGATINSLNVEETAHAFSNASVVVCQLEASIDSTIASFEHADRFGALKILNTAPIPRTLGQMKLMERACSMADIICPNLVEFAHLQAKKKIQKHERETEIKKLLKRFQSCKSVIVTLGSEGVLVAERGKTLVKIPTNANDRAVDTLGAGDSFVGALAGFLSNEREDLAGAASKANDLSSLSVTNHGSLRSFRAKR